ncbi:hypothetical protein V6N12_017969 [Hibiscus sabdariffa]|uniref:Uncharacterized protein n=1 Tax=Hibiscus sabdariffa TaxID=183260 RepID=A0ABR1ZY09_9ROSI
MELEMTHLVNGDVEDGGNSRKPSQPATITSDMKISFRDMVERRRCRPSIAFKTFGTEKGDSSSIRGSRFQDLADCEDSQHLNYGVNILFATVDVSLIHNVSFVPNSIVAAKSNKQQSTVAVADNMPGLSEVRSVIAEQNDARMKNVYEAVALQQSEKVVVAPSSLHVGKHTTVRVVDEGAKRVVPNLLGKAMYGPIRKAGSKGSTPKHGNVQGRGKASQVKPRVQWIDNHTYVGEERNSAL